MNQDVNNPRGEEHPVVQAATWKPAAETGGDGRWMVPADMLPRPETAAQNVTQVFHALRRHWLAVLVLGALLGGGAAAGTWFGWGARYMATAVLQVFAQQPVIAFRTADTDQRVQSHNAFAVFKDTQEQLIRSPLVTMAALRDPELAALPPIRKRGPAAAQWLAEEIAVRFPGDAEIMLVSITRRNPQEAATLVNAVVDAYMEEVVGRSAQERQDRLNELQQVTVAKEAELREQRNRLDQLAEQFGTGEDEAMRLKQQLVQQELADYRREYMRAQFDLRRARGELEAQRALLAAVDEIEISPYEMDELLYRDPVARPVAEQLAWKRTEAAYVSANVRPEVIARYASRYQSDLNALQSQFELRAQELREGVRTMKRNEIQQALREKEIEVAMLIDREQQLRADVERLDREARLLGGFYIDVETVRDKIEQLRTTLQSLGQERDKIEVELRSRPRIERLRRADVPVVQDGLPLRIALTVLAGLAGLALPLASITLWDLSRGRVNGPTDVSRGLGLPVAGSLPRIPPAVLRRLDSPGRRHRLWHQRLTESVDGVSARLLRQAEINDRRVILVTSADGAEGKSTLATQLAMSLARNGRRTVLVDFDLRRPAFAAVFGVDETPGIGEVLRGECDIAQVVHQTAIEGLSVVTAGRCDRQAITALANGAGAAVFKELRQEYDFVVADSSPVLPVADTRFLSQHADTVLLSVFQDASQMSKIAGALEILEAFGVRNMEAVVTGTWERHQDRSLRHEFEAAP